MNTLFLNMPHDTIILDISDNSITRSFGRLSCQIVYYLMGKHCTCYSKNFTPNTKVIILNSHLLFNIHKRKLSSYYIKHYSGYPRGLKIKGYNYIIEHNMFYRLMVKIIQGMLPKTCIFRKIAYNNLKLT